jgi:hypothetical protein
MGRREILAQLDGLAFENVRELRIQTPGVHPDPEMFDHLPPLPSLRAVTLGVPDEKSLTYMPSFSRSAIARRITDLDLDLHRVRGSEGLFDRPFECLERLTLRVIWLPASDLWTNLARGDPFPALVSLELTADRHVPLLSGHPVAERLEHLALRMDGDEGARAFLDARARFPRLKTLGGC